MDIRNIDDLEKAISDASDRGEFGTNSNVNIHEIFKEECERLKGYIIENMQDYMMDYQPQRYIPTGQWYDSLDKCDITYDTQDGQLTAIIAFDSEAAHHKSWIYPDEASQIGYAPWLMEVGWEWNKAPKRGHIYRFTTFDGIQYVLNAVIKFYQNNPYDLKIDVYFENQYGASELYILDGVKVGGR